MAEDTRHIKIQSLEQERLALISRLGLFLTNLDIIQKQYKETRNPRILEQYERISDKVDLLQKEIDNMQLMIDKLKLQRSFKRKIIAKLFPWRETK